LVDQITPADSISTRPPAAARASQGQAAQSEIAPLPEGGSTEGVAGVASGGRVVAVGVAVSVGVGLGVSVSGATTGGTVPGGVSVTVGVGLGVAVGVPVGVGLGVGLGVGVGVGVLSSRLVNVHFTTSSASSLNVAVADPTLPELAFALLASSQTIELRLKPAGRSTSVDVYVPTWRLVTTICPLSEMLPEAVPLKSKLPAAPPGMVCFSTMIEPRGTSSLVTVQVFVSSNVTEPVQSAEKLAA
jgi:hypothetical protein